MESKDIFEEFKFSFPISAIDYRPLDGKDTIIVFTKDAKTIVVKRIGNKNFEIKEISYQWTYTTICQIGKNAEKTVYIHDREKLCDSECIWKMSEKSVSWSADGGVNWTEI